MPRLCWTNLDVLFDIDSYLEADNWDAGKVLSVDVNRKWSFKDRDYVRDRRQFVAALSAFSIPDKLKPLAHCHLLARRWGATVQDVVLDIVVTFNACGQRYTAHKYRFAESHKFNWLPKTGVKVTTGLVWNPAAGCYVQWLPAYCPEDWCLQRELRDFPADYANTKLAITGKVRVSRSERRLQFDNFADGLRTLREAVSSMKASL